jgi:leukotriene-A4 hydrolase
MLLSLLGKVRTDERTTLRFKELNAVDRDLAVRTFEKNRDFYHPICRAMVEKDLFGKG